jgi:methyl-accepting chemotaxis protein
MVCAFVTYQMGTKAFNEVLDSKISSIQASKSHEILAYFSTIKDQLITFSSNQMVVDAMAEFQRTYRGGFVTPAMRANLTQYYENEFSPLYRKNNLDRSPAVNSMISQLDETSLYLQYHYISGNVHPLGEKHNLDKAADNLSYSQVHDYYHTHFRKYLNVFGYYDIFLVDIDSGDVIYSVFKELDYTTSLKTGTFKDSGIAKAFRGAAALNDPDGVYMTPFEPYTPSYESAASFIASPIFKDGIKIGVLIFQMPVDRINAIATNDGKWAALGLGDYGESLIVGEDRTVINQVRLFRENSDEYLDLISKVGFKKDIIDMIKARDSTIGLHSMDSEAVSAAFENKKGVVTQESYQGRSVLTGYQQLEFEGVKWALITNLDSEESFAGLNALTNSVSFYSIGICLLAAFLGAIIGSIFSNRVIQPLNLVVNGMQDISEGEGDLTKRLPVEGNDEIASLSQAFNGFADKVQATVRSLVHSVNTLASTVNDLNSVSSRSRDLIENQQQQSDMISTAITQMAASVQEVARNAETVATASGKSATDTQEAKDVFEDTLKEIESNTHKIEEAASVINQLEDETKRIGSVLDVIRGIAEQTNLLALNAAIEAARAGEQGRGFAVVADEVRTLASRTQSSTQEIEEMISRLQAGAGNAVAVMSESQRRGQASIEKGGKASEAISSTSHAISEISQMIIQVATATEEQSTVAEDINVNIVTISDLTSKITEEFRQLNRSVDQLTQCAHDLDRNANTFKV